MTDVLAKWMRICEILQEGKIPENIGTASCAFCTKYNVLEARCVGCPIYEETGERFCSATPYPDFVECLRTGHYAHAYEHAKQMYKFLLDLATKRNWIEYERVPDAPVIEDERKRFRNVIAKWEKIVRIFREGKIPTNTDARSCAFCVYYKSRWNDRWSPSAKYDFCQDCPLEHCGPGSLYHRFSYYYVTDNYPEAFRAAKDMLAHLNELYNRRFLARRNVYGVIRCPWCPDTPEYIIRDKQLADFLARHDIELEIEIQSKVIHFVVDKLWREKYGEDTASDL